MGKPITPKSTRAKVSKGAVRSSRSKTAEPPLLTRDALRALGGISDDQLRVWEFEELITHSTVLEVEGHRERVYNSATLRRIRTIRSLGEDLGINLPGIGVILHLLDQRTSRG
jgi:DNA-binding transcriptional MerR regulator